MIFRKNREWASGELILFADADYASAVNDMRLVSGAAVSVAGVAVSWLSRTLKCVTLSTTEAEYVAMTNVLKEVIYVRNVLSFMDCVHRKIVLREDNQGATALAENPVGSNNNKHIEVRIHCIREQVGLGSVEVFHVESAQQHAGILTKPLGWGSFELHRDSFWGGVHDG